MSREVLYTGSRAALRGSVVFVERDWGVLGVVVGFSSQNPDPEPLEKSLDESVSEALKEPSWSRVFFWLRKLHSQRFGVEAGSCRNMSLAKAGPCSVKPDRAKGVQE